MDNQERWYNNYEALKAHVLETGHFPNKHDKRLNWAKFQMKKIKAGTLDPERQRLFEELMAMRSGEHTGGRRRKAAHEDENENEDLRYENEDLRYENENVNENRVSRPYLSSYHIFRIRLRFRQNLRIRLRFRTIFFVFVFVFVRICIKIQKSNIHFAIRSCLMESEIVKIWGVG